tara:strand:- start:1029 stop:1688 length:660 start_codon:yes stop_codon:yes gene_type:complete
MSTLTVGTIAEKVTDAGVAVDGVTLKDGGATFTSAVGVTGNTTITSGNLVIGTSGNGIDFSASGDSSLATQVQNELLDEYEQGFFTPIYKGADSNPTITYDGTVGNEGYYVRIGRMCFIQINIRTDAVSGGSGNLKIGGLPFTTPNKTSQGGKGSFAVGGAFLWGGDSPCGATIDEGSSNIQLNHRTSANANMSLTQVSDLGTGANDNQIHLSGCYYVE